MQQPVRSPQTLALLSLLGLPYNMDFAGGGGSGGYAPPANDGGGGEGERWVGPVQPLALPASPPAA
jgi:hypothetical protein